MTVLERFSLKGKTALLTGGAGLYGRQLVSALAEAGATTYIASRNTDALQIVADECTALGQDVRVLRLDQGDEESILAVRDEILKQSGRIDILVNNSVARPVKNGMASDAASFEMSMKINATGLFLMTRTIGDVLSDGGSIVNIGSMQGMVGPDPTIYEGTEMNGWYPDYFFHKGGMINFSRFTASYYGSRGIRCNCICPGGFQMPSHPAQFVYQYSARTMLGRMADSTDLQGIVVFLASDASCYITGAIIPVDGGYTAR